MRPRRCHRSSGAGWNASDAAEKLRRAYVLSARQALQADTMSTEEYRSGLIDVEATVRAILERIQHIRASDDAARLIRAGSAALQQAANASCWLTQQRGRRSERRSASHANPNRESGHATGAADAP